MAKALSKLNEYMRLRKEAIREWKRILRDIEQMVDLLNKNAVVLQQPQYRLVKQGDQPTATVPAKRAAQSRAKGHGKEITEEWLAAMLKAPGKTFRELQAEATAQGYSRATKSLRKVLVKHKGKLKETEGEKPARGKAPTVYTWKS